MCTHNVFKIPWNYLCAASFPYFFGVFRHLQGKMPHPLPIAEPNEEHGGYVV